MVLCIGLFSSSSRYTKSLMYSSTKRRFVVFLMNIYISKDIMDYCLIWCFSIVAHIKVLGHATVHNIIEFVNICDVWDITKLSQLCWFGPQINYYFWCEGSACLFKYKTGILAATADKHLVNCSEAFVFPVSQSWRAQCIRLRRGGSDLMLQLHYCLQWMDICLPRSKTIQKDCWIIC